ncbi:MAG: hypothetical protein Alpg2KO_12520 [Alphaproteobacteria bacterium]
MFRHALTLLLTLTFLLPLSAQAEEGESPLTHAEAVELVSKECVSVEDWRRAFGWKGSSGYDVARFKPNSGIMSQSCVTPFFLTVDTLILERVIRLAPYMHDIQVIMFFGGMVELKKLLSDLPNLDEVKSLEVKTDDVLSNAVFPVLVGEMSKLSEVSLYAGGFTSVPDVLATKRLSRIEYGQSWKSRDEGNDFIIHSDFFNLISSDVIAVTARNPIRVVGGVGNVKYNSFELRVYRNRSARSLVSRQFVKLWPWMSKSKSITVNLPNRADLPDNLFSSSDVEEMSLYFMCAPKHEVDCNFPKPSKVNLILRNLSIRDAMGYRIGEGFELLKSLNDFKLFESGGATIHPDLFDAPNLSNISVYGKISGEWPNKFDIPKGLTHVWITLSNEQSFPSTLADLPKGASLNVESRRKFNADWALGKPFSRWAVPLISGFPPKLCRRYWNNELKLSGRMSTVCKVIDNALKPAAPTP